jgi:FixJ family two-component response regulator
MSQLAPIALVVDDDVSVRESLELLLISEGLDVELYISAQDFLARPRVQSPCCLILDIALPDLNGLELQKQIASDRLDMPIIFNTGYGDIPMTVKAIKAGAIKFLTKPFKEAALLSAIRQAIVRSEAMLSQESERRQLRDRYALLSRREQGVTALVVTGLLNKQVGGHLGISEITVKAHRGRVMQKMRGVVAGRPRYAERKTR